MEEDPSCEVRDDLILRCGSPVSNMKSGELFINNRKQPFYLLNAH